MFHEALVRVPLSDQQLIDCSRCGHACFVQRSARKFTEIRGVPVLCVQCAIDLQDKPVPDLHLEECPVPCPFAGRVV